MPESAGDNTSTIPAKDVRPPIPTLSPVKVRKDHRRHSKGDGQPNVNFGKDYHVAKEEGPSGGLDLTEKMQTASNITTLDKHSHGNEERDAHIHDAGRKRSVGKISSPSPGPVQQEKVLKLSPEKIEELTSSPSSLPLRVGTPISELPSPLPEISAIRYDLAECTNGHSPAPGELKKVKVEGGTDADGDSAGINHATPVAPKSSLERSIIRETTAKSTAPRPDMTYRTVSTPSILYKHQSNRRTRDAEQSHVHLSKSSRAKPASPRLNPDQTRSDQPNGSAYLKPATPDRTATSPTPHFLPVPPLSLATSLQLELSCHGPSPLYIYRESSSAAPYESSRVKFERLVNFLLLPPELEQTLWFGALACLDAWLYTFTILPLRFLKALTMLIQWWARNAVTEAHNLASFVYRGLGRTWTRRGQTGIASVPSPLSDRSSRSRSHTFPSFTASITDQTGNGVDTHTFAEQQCKHRSGTTDKHRRTKSTPSVLMPTHKADLLKGCLVVVSCAILMRFDASRMYHSIRGQAAIKLYVIYNVLEVCDRLFSALGQDVLECLFSRETLERNPDGRSKIFRPFWMFLLALAYTVIHSTALFYQVITLNVAVNSYSNALLTLLMSNQFVEIKGTVFKKFEKENLFQLTCADVVERFQLWLMLMIIALRNIVEVGGLSISSGSSAGDTKSGFLSNVTGLPFSGVGIFPWSFITFPKWTSQVMGPFLLVLGSEMLVDWLKHAYITKFNNTKPAIYGRFLDVLAKDYYSNAFAEQNLTKRLGLPVIPLSCLFIRASMQTYRMFLATYMPLPLPSTATSLSLDSTSSTTSPTATTILAPMNQIFRRALGRSSFDADGAGTSSWLSFTFDDIIALATMALFFLVAYLLLLAFKLVLGMCLLSFARKRYMGVKERGKEALDTKGRRVGSWGVVEVDEEKKKWMYHDDPEGMKASAERERKARDREGKADVDLGGVSRYSMVAKRIW